MAEPQRTVKGFIVGKRCDECGIKTCIAVEEEDKCILKCKQCGKEFRFFLKKE